MAGTDGERRIVLRGEDLAGLLVRLAGNGNLMGCTWETTCCDVDGIDIDVRFSLPGSVLSGVGFDGDGAKPVPIPDAVTCSIRATATGTGEMGRTEHVMVPVVRRDEGDSEDG